MFVQESEASCFAQMTVSRTKRPKVSSRVGGEKKHTVILTTHGDSHLPQRH